MTTTDARKRNRDARDAAWMLAALNGTDEPRTRTHSINPETGEFTPLDFHREWLHVMDTQRPHTPQETDMEPIPDTLLRMQRQINDMFERLSKVEAGGVEAKVAPFDPDVIAANLEAIKHEAETPMRGHGECCDPAPADVDPDEALAKVAFGEYMLSPSWDEAEPDMRKAWLDVARAAREHIEAERIDAEAKRDQWKADVRDAAIARADKAEADLARVTEERDQAWRFHDAALEALKKAEAKADDYESRYEISHASFLAASSDLDKVQAKADRYGALREDLEDKFSQVEVEDRGHMPAFASRVLKGILDRDTERAES